MNRHYPTNQCEECGGELVQGKSSYLCSKCGLEHDSLYLSTNSSDIPESSINKTINETQLGSIIELSETNNTDNQKHDFESNDQDYIIQEIVKQIPEFKFKLYPKSEQEIIKTMRKVLQILKAPPKVQDRSIFLYFEYRKKCKGRSIKRILLSAVAIYITSFEFKTDLPVTLKEITSAYEKTGHIIREKSILRIVGEYRLRDKSLGIKKSEDYISKICKLLYRTHDMLDKIRTKYGIDRSTYRRLLESYSLEILKKIPLSERGSKIPFQFAVAIVLVLDNALSRKFKRTPILTRKIVSQYTKVSIPTIRKNLEIIHSYDLEDVIEGFYKEIRIKSKKKYKS